MALLNALLIHYSHIFFVFPADDNVAVEVAIRKSSFESDAIKGGYRLVAN